MRTSKFTESQIVATLKQADAGLPVKDICRQAGDGNRIGITRFQGPEMKSALLFCTMMLFAFSVSAKADDFDQAFEVGKVAASHFESQLTTQRLETDKKSNGDKELANYVYDTENYAVGLSRSPGMYVIVFSLKQVKGKEILGGGAKYEVGESDLKIKNFVFYE